MSSSNKIPLYGFNNLTKNLCFSLYRVHYLTTPAVINRYNSFINNCYSSDNLNVLLNKVCHAIGGNVLNIAKQDYLPQGASVTLMISEEAKPESLVAHLDKSHLCIHTYPEEMPQNGVAVFRADIELSTCGVISPLKVIDYVIEAFSADVVDIDYRIRGMTRDGLGKKHFNDQKINKLSEHLSQGTIEKYKVRDSSLPQSNLFHCKLAKKYLDLDQQVFEYQKQSISAEDKIKIKSQLMNEIKTIYSYDAGK
jgi:S-adenosylmethionine decarboxylase